MSYRFMIFLPEMIITDMALVEAGTMIIVGQLTQGDRFSMMDAIIITDLMIMDTMVLGMIVMM